MSINTTMQSYKLSVKRATRRSRRTHQTRTSTTTTTTTSGSSCRSNNFIKPNTMKCKRKFKLSQKLQALKNLIPASNNNGDINIVKPDQLFQETADYIVLLRTRVLILQKLIEYYDGNNTEDNENVVLL